MSEEYTDEELEEVLPFQTKPKKSLNYQEKVRAGIIRGGLRQVSKKKQKEQSHYSKRSQEWLVDKHCEICGQPNNLSLHHMNGRGVFLNIEEYWMALCLAGSRDFLIKKFPGSNMADSCHDWVHKNGKLARKLGYITNYKL